MRAHDSINQSTNGHRKCRYMWRGTWNKEGKAFQESLLKKKKSKIYRRWKCCCWMWDVGLAKTMPVMIAVSVDDDDDNFLGLLGDRLLLGLMMMKNKRMRTKFLFLLLLSSLSLSWLLLQTLRLDWQRKCPQWWLWLEKRKRAKRWSEWGRKGGRKRRKRRRKRRRSRRRRNKRRGDTHRRGRIDDVQGSCCCCGREKAEKDEGKKTRGGGGAGREEG